MHVVRRIVLGSGLVALGVVAFVAPRVAVGQDTSGEPGDGVLPVRLEKGKPVRFRIFTHAEYLNGMAADGPASFVVNEKATQREFTLTLGDKDERGDTEVTCTFGRVWGYASFDGRPEAFDSKSARPPDPRDLSLRKDLLSGCTVTLKLRPDGAYFYLIGDEAEVDRIAAGLAPGDEHKGWARSKAEGAASRRVIERFLVPFLPMARPPHPGRKNAVWSMGEVGVDGAAFAKFDTRLACTNRGADSCRYMGRVDGELSVPPYPYKSLFEAVRDDTEDVCRLDADVELSTRDGLPIRGELTIDIAVHPAEPTSAHNGYFKRERRTIVRMGPDAPEAPTPSIRTLFPAGLENRYVRILSWLDLRAALLADAVRFDEALSCRREALELAGRLASGDPELKVGKIDGSRRAWQEQIVRIKAGIGAMWMDDEDWTKALAAWWDVFDDPRVVAGAKADDPWFLWERFRAGLTIARIQKGQGDVKASLGTSSRLDKDLAAAVGRLPDEQRLGRLRAICLDDWSRALQSSGDAKGALLRSEQAIEVRDTMAAKQPRSPTETRDLVNDLRRTADLALAAGNVKQAVTHLDRAHREVAALFPYGDEFKSMQVDIGLRLTACRQVVEGGEPAGFGAAAELGHVLYTMRQYARAVPHYVRALEDPVRRDDPAGDTHLMAASCAAMAHGTASDADKPRFAELALGWLGTYATRMRQLVDEGHPDDAAWARRMLRSCEREDPDFASLRALPAFAKLFR